MFTSRPRQKLKLELLLVPSQIILGPSPGLVRALPCRGCGSECCIEMGRAALSFGASLMEGRMDGRTDGRMTTPRRRRSSFDSALYLGWSDLFVRRSSAWTSRVRRHNLCIYIYIYIYIYTYDVYLSLSIYIYIYIVCCMILLYCVI